MVGLSMSAFLFLRLQAPVKQKQHKNLAPRRCNKKVYKVTLVIIFVFEIVVGVVFQVLPRHSQVVERQHVSRLEHGGSLGERVSWVVKVMRICIMDFKNLVTNHSKQILGE